MSRISSLLLSLSIPVVGIVAALGVVEVGIRVFVPSGSAKGPAWSDRPAFYYRSPQAPTMQDYPYDPKKPEGTFRIGVVGDSFTFAPYMQFTDTFPKKLEQILNVNGAATKAEVINYGVPAYSTSHEIAVAKQAVGEGADLIILQITLNDPELKAHRPTGIRENMEDRFGALKMSGTKEWLARHWRTYGWVLTRLHNTRTHNAYIEYFTDLFENPRTWNPFVDSMKRLVGEARSAGKPIVAVVFPLFGIPMDDHYPFYAVHKKVDDLLTSLSVPHLDISEIYKGVPLDRLQVIPGVDRHPNEIGHRMAAEQIYLWLEEQNLIPAELKVREKFATRLGTTGNRPYGESPSAQ